MTPDHTTASWPHDEKYTDTTTLAVSDAEIGRHRCHRRRPGRRENAAGVDWTLMLVGWL